ncbi:Breast cancer metastasis-suppressor 1-like protein, partial [Xenoophorus captivus]
NGFFGAAPGQVKADRHHHVARSEEGRLFYNNQWYCRGQTICINRKDEYPTRYDGKGFVG